MEKVVKKLNSLLFILSFIFSFAVFFARPQLASATFREDTCTVIVSQERDGDICYAPGCIANLRNLTVKIENLVVNGESYTGSINVRVGNPRLPTLMNENAPIINGTTDDITFLGTSNANPYVGDTSHEVQVRLGGRSGRQIIACNSPFAMIDSSFGATCSSCLEAPASIAEEYEEIPYEICNQINDTEQKDKCLECFGDESPGSTSGIWTAVGCIPTKAESIVATAVKIGLSVGGGITLLLILAGSFQLSISQGDPKKADEAKEQITSAIIGLIFIILSVTILQFIGVKLFQIPGLGG